MLIYGFPILAALIALFFLPSIVARSRDHPDATAIFALNVFLGWTVVGWAIALVWALTSEEEGATLPRRPRLAVDSMKKP
jgi:hypothetical protein